MHLLRKLRERSVQFENRIVKLLPLKIKEANRRKLFRSATAIVVLITFYFSLFQASGIPRLRKPFSSAQAASRPVFDPAPFAAGEYQLHNSTPGERYSVPIPATGNHKIVHGKVTLEIGQGAVTETTPISVHPLNAETTPELDQGMTNLTADSRAYRFGPDGMKFKGPIRITIPFDKKLLEKGFTASDIYSFYFDTSSSRWVRLQRVAVNQTEGTIVSLTDHFTDFITATITTPDQAGSNPMGFNPNSMKDIKVANPTLGITELSVPSANSSGAASMNYPLLVPPGRLGLQPDLQVSYNSGGGNGWMGLGWDLRLPAVSIDTRWGVPRYDGASETESYIINGAPLAPLAHRGAAQARTAEKTFRRRVEGGFQKIIRHGGAPGQYWWEVVGKNGLRSFYGGTPESGRDDAAVLSAAPGTPAFKWGLKEVRDLNGNTVQYSYARVEDVGTVASLEPGVQLYPKEIRYTGRPNSPGAYRVVFIRDREQAGFARRNDVSISARPGFKTVTADRLKRVEVRYNNDLIRAYEFSYREGAYLKTLLESFIQKDVNDSELARHTLDYYDEVRTNGIYLGFLPPFAWGNGSDGILDPLTFGYGRASAIGGTTGKTRSWHFYRGLNPVGASKSNSAGQKKGSGVTITHGATGLIDLNGDGLPDKVFRSLTGTMGMRLNLSGPGKLPTFGPPVPILLPALSLDTSSSTTKSTEAYPSQGSIISGKNTSLSMGTAYMSDVNGDGLPDLVLGGVVLFNVPGPQGQPLFSPDSSQSPVKIGRSLPSNLEDMFPDLSQVYEERKADIPLLDSVRSWTAIFDGSVEISGGVQLANDGGCEGKPDGVRVAIQHKGTELRTLRINADDFSVHALDSSISVQKGERIYFRVQSIENGSCDRVHWDPLIEYTGVPGGTSNAHKRNPNRYKASEDFIYGGRDHANVAGLAGTLRIIGALEKPETSSDDFAIVIYKNDVEVLRKPVTRTQTGSIPLTHELVVAQSDKVKLKLESDSPLDYAKIQWQPEMYYISTDNNVPVNDQNGNPILKLPGYYDVSLFPENDLSGVQTGHKAVNTGTYRVTGTPDFDFQGNPVSGRVVFTVKRRGELLAKKTVEVMLGVVNDPGELSFTAVQDDELYFDFSVEDPEFAKYVVSHAVKLNEAGGGLATPPAALHKGVDGKSLFNAAFRGWSFIAYDGNGDRAALPLSEDAFILSGSYDPATALAHALYPEPLKSRWMGPDDRVFVSAGAISSSRMGMDDISVPTVADYQQQPPPDDFAGALLLPKISLSKTNTTGGGVGGAGLTQAKGTSQNLIDVQDLNGDRFPDIMGGGLIAYTDGSGGLASGGLLPNLYSRETKSKTFSVADGGLLFKVIYSVVAKALGSDSEMPPFGLSVELGQGQSDLEYELLDLNGDGLPDRVIVLNGALLAALNTGYGFGKPEVWGAGELSSILTRTASLGSSLGFSEDKNAFSGGLSLTGSDNQAKSIFQDINGDGLPDLVKSGGTGIWMALNTGAGFTPAFFYPGGTGRGVSMDKTVNLGAGGTVTVAVPIPFTPSSIILNPGFSTSRSISRKEEGFRDMNGDGFADHLYSDNDGQLIVSLSRIGKTNLLKGYTRPLGSSVALEYERKGNTFDQPRSRWNLSQVSVTDGFTGDGGDLQVNRFTYEGGKYNRFEREFYGYAKVTQEELNTDDGNSVYRRVIREYPTDSFYTKGLPVSQELRDGAGRLFTRSEHTYKLVDVPSGAIGDPASDQASLFPARIKSETSFYEGGSSAGKTQVQEFDYDSYGNVSFYKDHGDAGNQDDVEALIEYSGNTSLYIVGQPTKITVQGNGRQMRRREADYSSSTGQVTQIRRYLASGGVSITDLSYHADGNVASRKDPANAKSQRYTVNYVYDSALATHITGTSDSFGYTSTASYDIRFGLVTESTDINGNQSKRVYDAVGRPVQIFGPYQYGGSTPTIAFEYHPAGGLSWARTRHYDRFDGETVNTVLFTDGLRRVLQTKKSASVHTTGGSSSDRMVVSGRVRFDFLGRKVASNYPTTEARGSEGVFNSSFDGVAPAQSEYDVLDRVNRTVLPDGRSTSMSYGFGADRNGKTQFETVVTDAKGRKKHSYTNIRKLVTAIKEISGGSGLWTSYEYDALSQITSVIDAKNNVTFVGYDNLGRRVSINNPDTGLTETRYDGASNVVARITANLRAKGQEIKYAYDYGRLASVVYPEFTGNNITYTYDAPVPNGRGRIWRIQDQSGILSREYGKLGETLKETRRVFTKNSSESYDTGFVYDSWGRLRSLTYPDGEVLTYAYDSGGQMSSAVGVKGQRQTAYVAALRYDKFGQRAYINKNNVTETFYTYDGLNRRLTKLVTKSAGSTPVIQNMTYAYDQVDNITGLTNDVTGSLVGRQMGGATEQSFEYDDLNRMTGATGVYRGDEHYTLSMSYDAIHNVTSKHQKHWGVKKNGGQSIKKKTSYNFVYRYDGQQPHAPTVIGGTDYTYDLNGNQTGFKSHNTTRVITWDEENRIQSIADGGSTSSYRYDYSGARVLKEHKQGQTAYVSQFYAIRNGTIQTKHVMAGSDRIQSEVITSTDSVSYYYHPDHLGSTNYVTDDKGDIYEHMEYFPFGELWVSERGNTEKTPYLYTSKELDEDTQLMYFGARYYDARTSVWQSPDPILNKYLPTGDKKRDANLPGMGGVYNSKNLGMYSYGHQNPVKYKDPDGNEVTIGGGALNGMLNTKKSRDHFVKSASIGIVVGAAAIACVFYCAPAYVAGGQYVGSTAIGASILGLLGLGRGIDRVIKILRPGGALIGKGGTSRTIRYMNGGFKEATQLFQKLTKAGGGTFQKGIAKNISRFNFKDGGHILLRKASHSGANATIDVNIKGLQINSIKFVE